MREYVWRLTHDEKLLGERIKSHREQGSPLFLALLQKPGDMQLRLHSPYGSNAPYLQEVVASFSSFAPPNSVLLVKQHPLDYGGERLPELFDQLVHQHGIADRAYYLRISRVDALLDKIAGVVTINSSMGLEVLQAGRPLIAVGRAVYNMPGLTHQQGLETFWSNSTAADAQIVAAFTAYLKNHCQVNGGFYSAMARDALAKNFATRMLDPVVAPHILARSADLELLNLHRRGGSQGADEAAEARDKNDVCGGEPVATWSSST